jgi:hypothetical protein
MKIDFDPAKSEKNICERGLPFSLAEDFGWDCAFVVEDTIQNAGSKPLALSKNGFMS